MSDRSTRLLDAMLRAWDCESEDEIEAVMGEVEREDPALADAARSELKKNEGVPARAPATPTRGIGAGDPPRDDERPPERIGEYRIERELGRGGMSRVFLAKSTVKDYDRWVAIKVLRRDLVAEGAVERMQLERQILAGLQHSNIAQLLDGGVTKDGLHFVVMELVEGLPIDEYCDEERLGVEARVRLFLDICNAVGHAHGHLVVHRDLKPTNVLVSRDGAVKLLDFGVAKVLDRREASRITQHGMGPMTVQYASPEQVEGQGAISIQSDIYSLGVLLYELLAGRYPYAVKGDPPWSYLHAIREEEPRPMARALAHEPRPDSTEKSADEIAHRRRSTPRELSRKLEGDLDAVVRKALERDRQARYGSVAGLVADLESWLRHLPVSARTNSPLYRLEKLVRRNRTAVAAGVVAAIVLVGFTAHSWRQRMRAEAARIEAQVAREEAEEVVTFMQDVFRVADPLGAGVDGRPGDRVTARELLDVGAARVEREFERKPAVRARLATTIGTVYRNLGLFDEAEGLLSRAVRDRELIYGRQSLEAAETRFEQGRLALLAGRLEEAERELELVFGIREARLGPSHRDTVDSMFELANAYRASGRQEEAEVKYRTALRGVDQAEDGGLQSARIASELAILLNEKGDAKAAKELFSAAVDTRNGELGREHPLVAESLNNLGVFHGMRGEWNQSRSYFEEALRVRRAVFGPAHPDVAESLNNLGRLADEMEDFAEARRRFEEAASVQTAATDPAHPSVSAIRYNLGLSLLASGDLQAAEETLRAVLAVRRVSLSPAHSDLGNTLRALGEALVLRGDPQSAEPMLKEALAIQRDSWPAGHRRIAEAKSTLALCLCRQGRRAQGTAMAEEAVGELRTAVGPDHRVMREARRRHEACR